MTDLLTAPPEVPPQPVGDLSEPLWKIRLRLTRRSLAQNWKLFIANRIGLIGLVMIGIFALMAIAHPILLNTVWPPHVYHPINGYDAPVIEKTVVQEVTDPITEIDLNTARVQGNPFIDVGQVLQITQQPAPPTFGSTYPHYLGTDPLGRDVLSQLLYSTRSAFFLGMIAALVTVFIATVVGSVAAFFGGWVDSVLMRLADLILLVPLLPVLIVVSALFNISLPQLGLLIGILGGFGGTAIILKSQALQVTVKPFIDAARIAGGGNAHLIFRHVIPNVLPLSFLYMMFTVTDAIALEATLSFLGLLSIPMSWGIMISIARTQGYLLGNLDYWWLIVPAGLAVSLLAAAFFLVGRAMDEVVNPRLRQR
ncbi:MAG TPA: ABC transporter permease subunit [Acidimicrobiia bacterium]|nr:ABC transporter permease subunit [Acidimicrobiia bacterium]